MSEEILPSSAQTPTVANTDASPPFNDPTADVVIRTSDNVDFHLHKVILSFASPVFKDMFDLPQSSVTPKNRRDNKMATPIIPVTEDSKPFDRAMRFCYPGEHPKLETLGDVRDVMEIMQKYDMAGVGRHLRELLVAPRFLETEPLRVYLIACLYRLGDEARLAAKGALQFPMFGLLVEELKLVPASLYHQFMDYHQRCGNAAAGQAKMFSWMPVAQWTWFTCTRCYNEEQLLADGAYHTTSNWFVQHMHRAGDALRDRPALKTVSSPEMMQEAIQECAKCVNCRNSALKHLSAFTTTTFKDEMERVILEVPLNIDF